MPCFVDMVSNAVSWNIAPPLWLFQRELIIYNVRVQMCASRMGEMLLLLTLHGQNRRRPRSLASAIRYGRAGRNVLEVLAHDQSGEFISAYLRM